MVVVWQRSAKEMVEVARQQIKWVGRVLEIAAVYDDVSRQQGGPGVWSDSGNGAGVISERVTATTPIESNKPLVKDEDGVDVDVHVYRSIIGSLMYLTTSRPDIMFAVCACARFQVTPKASHLNAVKKIFRTVNNTSYIDATVAGKPVTISEASIRSDLLFDDADGIDSLNNQAIFDNIQLMGKLQLADATGIHNLSDAEIYAGLATLGGFCTITAMKRGYVGDFVPLLPAMLEGAAMDQAKSTVRQRGYRRRARSMAKNINTGLNAEDEINTGRVKVNTGIEDVNTDSTKVDTGRTSISTSSIILSPKKGQIEGKAQMVEEIYPATHKTTKNKNKTEEAGLEEA
ncbi:hypothetical protein Tco_0401822 [Tanacetum coccineum]